VCVRERERVAEQELKKEEDDGYQSQPNSNRNIDVGRWR